MKTVRLKNNIVIEIIPDYALPVEKWYGADFAAQCLEAPDNVKSGWWYQDGEWIAPEIAEFSNKKAAKTQELSAMCEATIYAGMDIELPNGTTEHFNYNDHDQINIKEMFDAARMGATAWPYQAEDGSCRAYTAAEIFTIYPTLAGMKTATLTYYHALEDLVNAAETAEAVEAITWGQPLEGDSLAHYNEMIAIAQAQMQTILGSSSNA